MPDVPDIKPAHMGSMTHRLKIRLLIYIYRNFAVITVPVVNG